MQPITFYFRKPKFPALVDTGTSLIVLRSAPECGRRLETFVGASDAFMPMIDATAEGFSFHTGLGAISPLTLKKKWNKAEIVELYNARRPEGMPPWNPTLSNRTLAVLVAEAADLLRPRRGKSAQPSHPLASKGRA